MEKGSGDEDIIKVNQSALSKTKVKEAYLSTHHSPLITHYSSLITTFPLIIGLWVKRVAHTVANDVQTKHRHRDQQPR